MLSQVPTTSHDEGKETRNVRLEVSEACDWDSQWWSNDEAVLNITPEKHHTSCTISSE